MRRQRLLFPALLVGLLLFAAPAFAQEQRVHTVRAGESLYRIAIEYGVTVNAIARANNLANTWLLQVGQQLIIPTSGSDAQTAAEIVATAAAPTYHTIRSGETILSIARQYSLTPSELARLNNIVNPNLIYAGQRLVVSRDGTPAQPTTQPPPATQAPAPAVAQPTTSASAASGEGFSIIHVVRSGELINSIATRYGVSWLAITQANNISNPNVIFAGQRLVIPNPTQNYQGAPRAGADGTVPTPNPSSLLSEIGILDVPAAPPAIIGVGKEIIVDLSDSRAYAYIDGVLVRNVLGSTGREGTPTVRGSFRVTRKYAAQTMSGPGYYLPNVPFVVYFHAGYALHGTYWHANWGTRMSHGCVNLPTAEAEWFYNFVEIGTPVTVQA